MWCISPIDSPRAAQRKKECRRAPWGISMGDAHRRASRGVYRSLSKGTPLDRALGQYRRMHASSPPAAGALCITGQRRRLTVASRIVVNIETPRVGFSWTEWAKKKGGSVVARPRRKKETRAIVLTGGWFPVHRGASDRRSCEKKKLRASFVSSYASARRCSVAEGLWRVQLFTWTFGKYEVCEETLLTLVTN